MKRITEIFAIFQFEINIPPNVPSVCATICQQDRLQKCSFATEQMLYNALRRELMSQFLDFFSIKNFSL